jgi:hypothetical protein
MLVNMLGMGPNSQLSVAGGSESVRKPKEEVSGARKRADGRRQMLVYLQTDIIRELKLAAIAEERPSYELVELAISEWLLKRGKRKR